MSGIDLAERPSAVLDAFAPAFAPAPPTRFEVDALRSPDFADNIWDAELQGKPRDETEKDYLQMKAQVEDDELRDRWRSLLAPESAGASAAPTSGDSLY